MLKFIAATIVGFGLLAGGVNAAPLVRAEKHSAMPSTISSGFVYELANRKGSRRSYPGHGKGSKYVGGR